MTLTADIRSIADNIITQANSIKAKADAIDAIPPPVSGGFVPFAWPAPLNLLGGTIPATMSVAIAGDGAPGGAIAEPYNTRKLDNLPNGTVGIFGDSILQSISENLISPFAVNYALGGQSLRRIVNSLRLTNFVFMGVGGAGVLQGGVNDLSNTSYYGPRSNHQAALQVLSIYQTKVAPFLTGKWVIVDLLPCNEPITGAVGYNAQVAEVNASLAAQFATTAATIAYVHTNPILLDAAGNLKAIYALADGQHPNKAGAAIIAADIYAALHTLGIQ